MTSKFQNFNPLIYVPDQGAPFLRYVALVLILFVFSEVLCVVLLYITLKNLRRNTRVLSGNTFRLHLQFLFLLGAQVSLTHFNLIYWIMIIFSHLLPLFASFYPCVLVCLPSFLVFRQHNWQIELELQVLYCMVHRIRFWQFFLSVLIVHILTRLSLCLG